MKDDAKPFECRESQVSNPETHEKHSADPPGNDPAADLSTRAVNRHKPSKEEHKNSETSENREENDRELEVPGRDEKVGAVEGVNESSESPGDPDSQEDVHRVRAGDVPDRRIRVPLHPRRDTTRERVCYQRNNQDVCLFKEHHKLSRLGIVFDKLKK